MDSPWLPFGVLRRPHGISGEIVLAPFNTSVVASRPSFPQTMPVRLSQGEEISETELLACRPFSEGLLVRLKDCASREAAAALVGREVHVLRALLAPLSDFEFYVEDVLGCEVATPSGLRLGRVARSFWNGAHDVMAVVGEDGHERLLPVVAEFVRSFDRARGLLIVDPHE